MHGTRLLILVAALGWSSPAAAQDAQARDFLTRAAKAAERYRDVAAAIEAGYRAVGPEIPAMGQHWIQPSLLASGRADPDEPPILEYATIGGRRVLVGVAYAILLEPGAAPPDVPVSRHWWHRHGGDLDEESLSDSHAGSGAVEGDGVAVLHAWVPITNPAGPFVAENWTLPFLRAGLSPPNALSAASARAMALGTGAFEHFLAQYRDHDRPDSAADAAATASFEVARDSVTAWLARRGHAATVSPEEQAWLEGVWYALEDRLSGWTAVQRED
jgi:hypothetical protein